MVDEPKGRVNWTLDQVVIRAVREEVKRRSAVSGVTISESAAANAMLTEFIVSRQAMKESSKQREDGK